MEMNEPGLAPAFLFLPTSELIDQEEHEGYWVSPLEKPVADAWNFAGLFSYSTVFKRLIKAVPWRRIAL
ncbi:hypothetical protein PQR46_27385 [Paraburkholderia sediminicola]|uniref:hypothetical protein n=1 Tax=Paraburkholderia TaxID=1822464 RepID=UPI0038BB0F59